MRRPSVLVGAQPFPAGLPRGTADELWAELPTAFARTEFPLAEQPYAALFYWGHVARAGANLRRLMLRAVSR